MKYSTKEYKNYKVGDLLIYEEGTPNEDIGYIVEVNTGKEKTFLIQWLKSSDVPSSRESIKSLILWKNGYVLPVSKT